jgi:RNA polymerase sigma-70 factor (ECF subfamily)
MAFEELWKAHHRELLVHCYRMLGSWTDAEDTLQEVSLRAWRGLARFEGRASARSWLYRIATNACLTALRRRGQRTLPELLGPPAPAGRPLAPPEEQARWIQPFPTATGSDLELAASRESTTLAFVVALQQLPPRQRAALLLREVVGYQASEVAAILQTTAPAVNSALIRARARMARFRRRHEEPKPASLTPRQRTLLERYVQAWEAGDVEAIVSLCRRDAIVSMPPYATWYRGRPAIARWLRNSVLADGHAYRLLPTAANGRPAFAIYQSGPSLAGRSQLRAARAHCIQVLWLGGRHVARIVSFLDPRLVESFGFSFRLPSGAR